MTFRRAAHRLLSSLALLAVGTVSAAASAQHEDDAFRQQVVEATAFAQAAERGALPKELSLNCVPLNLPTTPQGPTWSMVVEDIFLGQRISHFRATAWRYPCPGGNDHQLIVTLTPLTPDLSVGQLFNIQQPGNGLGTFNTIMVTNVAAIPFTGHLARTTSIMLAYAGGQNGFDDDAALTLRYTGLGRGPFEVQIPAVSVSSTPPPAAYSITGALDGVWWNPMMDGQGFFIDVDTAARIVALGWYTAHPQTGAREWFTALGSYTGDKATLTVYRTNNIQFIRPGTGSTTAAGTATLRFSGCDRAYFEYQLDIAAGGSELRKLTSTDGCN
jgi:hypothetical protein